MMAFVRFLRSKSDWDLARQDHWKSEEDFPLNVYRSLPPTDSSLSVYLVDIGDGGDCSKLDRLLAAFGAARTGVSALDYVKIEEQHILQLGLVLEESAGRLPDQCVNQWHRDLKLDSGKSLYMLAKTMYQHGIVDRRMPRSMKDLIRRGVDRNEIARSEVSGGVLADIGDSGPPAS